MDEKKEKKGEPNYLINKKGIHNKTGENLITRKSFGNVFICELIIPRFYREYKQKIPVFKCVCHINNITFSNVEQLKIDF